MAYKWDQCTADLAATRANEIVRIAESPNRDERVVNPHCLHHQQMLVVQRAHH